MFRVFFHIVVLAINCYTMYYDRAYIDLPLPVEKMHNLPLKSRSMYLTAWCLMLQTLYYFIALLNDIVGTNAATNKPPVIRKIKDTVFPLAFNIAVYVTLCFWSFYTYKKELIVPLKIDKLYPPALNHTMHTTILFFMIIEMLLPYKTYPSRLVGISMLFSFTVCYTAWFYTIYMMTGVWVYPFFNIINWPLRILVTAVHLILAPSFYIYSENINNFICNTNIYTYKTIKGKYS